MTAFPHSTFFFYLSPHSLIMNPTLPLKSHVLEPRRLESLMLRDKPVVPPDSVIRTFSHLIGEKIDLIISQDGEGLCQGSFILRRGEWAKFFLDTWFDPLYRSYNFQKAEGHALVWEPSLLFCCIACVLTWVISGTRRPMASYNPNKASPRASESIQLVRY